MDYATMLSPLVSVSGIGSDVLPPYSLKQPFDKLILSTTNVEDVPLIRNFAKSLSSLSQPPGPWDPKTSRDDRVNFVFTNSISVPSRTKKPSLLSPRHPECSDPIFTSQWLQKYLVFLPAVSIVVVNVPKTDRDIEDFLTVLLTLRDTISQYGIHLTAIVLGKNSELARVVPILRKQSGLSPKYGLLAMADDLNPEELKEFVHTVYEAALTKSREFFSNKISSLREKRRAVSPSQDLLAWDARYTLKLAYCSEFKGDLAGALKLYESSYDSLAVLFENSAITTKSPAYNNAREVLDAVALKILQRSLPSRMAFEKFLVHISTVEQAWAANDIDADCKNALNWKGMQYAQFAKLCTTLKHAGVASTTSSQSPTGTPTGLIWLNAAKLLATEPNSEANEDPFTLDPSAITDMPFDSLPQAAFINAISDLSGFRRTRAYALMQYGDWLNKTDANAALEAFKSARQALSSEIWPDLQLHLSERLGEKFTLFKLGASDEFVPPTKEELTALPPLFECTGTFEAPSTHIGQEICAQVTLTPKFPGVLSLSTLRIHHSLGSVVFQDEEKPENEENHFLVVASDVENSVPGCLDFSKACSRTFQFSITSVNTGEIELKFVELFNRDGFSQKINIESASEAWLLTDERPHARNKKHLPVLSTPTVALVNTRPAKLEVLDNTPSTGAVGESLLFNFEIRSFEDEDIVPKISVTLDSRDLDTPSESLLVLNERLEAKGPYVAITGRCIVPSLVFELVITTVFETSTDKLPVVYEYRKEVDVVKPFRVSYDLVPEYQKQDWPAFFAPTLELPQITRTWRLSSTILSLFSNADVILRSSKVHIDCDTAAFTIVEPSIALDDQMCHNAIKHISHRFTSCLKPGTSPSIKTVEAVAHAELTWARKADPSVNNVFKLPPIHLNLPTQEPRVLVVANKMGNSAELSQVSYHIENPSARLLNFSISMSSSIYHAFQGPKQVSIRMLPFSTRSLTYQLIPLGDGAVQNKRPLPELRVYDVNYKRTLAILPGDENVTFHQGTLFL